MMAMAGQPGEWCPKRKDVTVEDVKRVLAAGRLLLSALSPEELDELRAILARSRVQGDRVPRNYRNR
jgi:hypothetical protein